MLDPGGRLVTAAALHRLINAADHLPDLSFVDLDEGLVDHELARIAADQLGPTAESLLRQIRQPAGCRP